MLSNRSIVVVGAGVFGVTASVELRRRGFAVTLIDPGPLPHPDASSTDVSKAVRMDYGSDELYTSLAERSIEGWQRWNRVWERPLYHQVGFLLLTRDVLSAGSYEASGFELLQGRGQKLHRVNQPMLERSYPAWRSDRFNDGYLNPRGGWVESSAVMRWLIDLAIAEGVEVRQATRFARLQEVGSKVAGVVVDGGEILPSDHVLVSAGAWTPFLLPQLGELLCSTGQQVLHFQPSDPEPYRGERFPVWGADISSTGWYGFPLTRDGVVKVGRHAAGKRLHPEAPREVDPAHVALCRGFLAEVLPDLAVAPLVAGRICLYCDSWDGNFWFDHDPQREGLIVAAGGSGHGFKFAPILGEIIADVVERKADPYHGRFSWRSRGAIAVEQARSRTE